MRFPFGPVASLPDLNALPGEALRALILAQREQLLSAEDRLTATQEQLQSRASARLSICSCCWPSCTACSLGGSRKSYSGRSSSWSCGWRNWNRIAARKSATRQNQIPSSPLRLLRQRNPRAALCRIIFRDKRAGTSRRQYERIIPFVLYRNYFVDWTARQFGAQQPYPLVLKF